MNWNNLKNNECPQCGKVLTPAVSHTGYGCFNCHFTISKAKFDKIVNDLYKPKQKRCGTFDDNGEALNNLGHEEVTEDFSDSRFI